MASGFLTQYKSWKTTETIGKDGFGEEQMENKERSRNWQTSGSLGCLEHHLGAGCPVWGREQLELTTRVGGRRAPVQPCLSSPLLEQWFPDSTETSN